MTVWLLGTHLNPNLEVLAGADRVLLVEAHGFAERKPYHPQKLTLLFSAMRHFREELEGRGYDVSYRRAESFGEGLAEHFADHPGDELRILRPASHGAAGRLRDLIESRGGKLTVLENELFLVGPDEFDEWAAGRDTANTETYRLEPFYRHVRREHDVLMDGEDPVGDRWNFDEENRETPPEGWDPPSVPEFEPDATTREVRKWVGDRYGDHWGAEGPFRWPVTRPEALEALEAFVDGRFAEFGPYQDAMLEGEWALCHSLLSSSLNLGLLHPREVVRRAEEAFEEGAAPLRSVEGFVRQVLGWREFLRHVYRRRMPEMARANGLEAERPLPEAYWTGETGMNCLSEAVGHVHERGYAHHIERLMVLSNFALVYGADPHELNEWFHLGFVDAYHWVTTPNVVGMGSFATDAASSKPYASSGNYIDRMSDYCESCAYNVDATTGEGACPFNSLYWRFLEENEETLRGTGRMGLMYSHVDRKDESEWRAIRERAEEVRERAREGDL